MAIHGDHDAANGASNGATNGVTNDATIFTNKAAITDDFEGKETVTAQRPKSTEPITLEETEAKGKTTGFSCTSLWEKLEGKILIFLGGILLAIAFSFNKLIPEMGVGQVTSITCLIGTFLVLPCLFFQEDALNFHGKAKFIIPRAFFGGLFIIFSFWSARVMDYGDSTALSSLVPVFAALFSRVLWKEKISIYTIVALVVGVGGMVLIARPSFIFGVPDDSEKKEYSPFFPLVPIAGSLMLGFAYSLMRKVGTKVSPLFVSTFVFFMTFIDGIIFQFIFKVDFVLPGCYADRGFLFAGGLGLFLSLICFNRGLTLEKSGPGLLMKNVDIIVAYIIQIAFFHSVPGATSIIGTVLVLSSIVLVTVEKTVFKRCRIEI